MNNEELLKKQSRIVKARLSYHFASTQGGWNIEGMPPFMKEFLNEVNKLCNMVIEESWNKGESK